MRFVSYSSNGKAGLAILDGQTAYGLSVDDAAYPGDLHSLIVEGGDALERAGAALRKGQEIDLEGIEYLPPLGLSGAKIICLGVNYVDHVKETGNKMIEAPTTFARFSTSLIGHKQNLVRPKVSTQFDYEAELVAVIGKTGRHIPKEEALDYVVGWTLFNDGTIRDYQFASTQWTVGKNFDGTGAIGPIFVTADEIPAGGKGLKIECRLNGQVVQSDNTENMIFDVATSIEYLSKAYTFEPGDLLVSGTPQGVGWARKPQLFMKDGDVCEVEVESIGILSNPVVDEE